MIPRAELLKASIICFLFAVAIVMIFILAGCVPMSRQPHSPAATVTTSAGDVLTQSGDAQVPASVSSKTNTQTITLPAQSIVWQNAQTGAIEYRLAKDAPLTAVTKTEQATAPTAFTPPAPPTVAEVKEGQMIVWYRVGLVVGIAAALFGLVRGWDFVMYGGGCVAGACLFGLFVQSHPLLLVVIGLGVGLKIAGPVLWHTTLKHLPAKIP